MERFIQPQQWISSDGIILEENADIAVRMTKNLLVVAGPGAGKTELLAQKAGYLFKTNLCTDPTKILAISFKKDAAENLKKRVVERFGDSFSMRFSSMTYDAFAKMLLDHFRFALPEELRPNEGYKINDDEIIQAACIKAGDSLHLSQSGNLLNKHYNDLISKASLPLSENELTTKVWTFLLKGFSNYPACLTFKMICKLSEYIIRINPLICRALRCTYSYVFLDEFQDTTALQYTLITTCFKDSQSILTAVGDRKQRIMLWAGAKESVFADYQKDFTAKQIQLTMNHRSAPRLVKLQKQMYASLLESDITIETSKKWGKDDGEIKLFITQDDKNEATSIVEDIKSVISNGIKPEEICILCKQKPQDYTIKIISELDKQGIKARLENDYQDLLKEPVVLLLINCLTLVINRRNPDAWEYVNQENYAFLNYDYAISQEKFNQDQESLTSMIAQVSNCIPQCTTIVTFMKLIDVIIEYWGVNKIKTTYPSYSQGDFFNKILQQFCVFLWKEISEVSLDWDKGLRNFLGEGTIPIMTIHKSKGLEYSAVYFIGLEDGAFWNFKNQSDQDRCAFFVALSRAKQYVSFSFCGKREGFWFPIQNHNKINEFFELLKIDGMAKIIRT
jgi:superfamily I DNA/RNA helicase